MSHTLSLTLHEARARAALIGDVAYDLELDLTDRESFGIRALITFSCRTPGAETFLELADADALLLDGRPPEYADGRIILRDLRARNEIVVTARLPYVSDGEGMHTFTDPADGEVYASAYCGMDVSRRVFPCFDQNDLKATVALRVTAPDHWTVLANGRVTSRDGGRWEFATTPPLPPAMFAVCGGPWASVTWEHAGLPFGWHARASLGRQLERDAAELRRITEACFDHYGEIFDEPYPFDSYDQAMVPGLNWGAMEVPGCITYRDEYLTLGEPTEPERRGRAMVIAHEMAHMWFGNLVTMTWWEDTWLQESFADYLGFRVSGDAAGIGGAFVDFTVARKPAAYLADERRSTHPVAPRAEDVPDLDAASVNFDALSYAKGNSALRQLVTWLGDDAFFAGVNAYLSQHRWSNATLDDFVTALDGVTDRDVRAWVDRWLRTTGFDTIRATRDSAGVLLTREGSRPHRVRVASYDAQWRQTASDFVDLGDEPVRVPGAVAVIPNAGGETFARVRLDPGSWAAIATGLTGIAEPEVRAVVWSTAFDMVWTGDLTADAFLGLIEAQLVTEPHAATVQAVLSWARTRLVPLFVSPAGAAVAVSRIAAACVDALQSRPGAAKAVILTRCLAGTTADPDLLHRWLDEPDQGAAVTAQGVPVDPALRWLVRHRLAALGEATAADLESARAAEGTIVADLGALTAIAALPDPAGKARVWDRITGDPHLSNREMGALAAGLWDVEQTELLGPQVDAYLSQAVPLGVRRGASYCDQLADAFPTVALTEDQVETLAEALAGDVPVHLRRPWEDQLDDLRRADAARR